MGDLFSIAAIEQCRKLCRRYNMIYPLVIKHGMLENPLPSGYVKIAIENGDL